MVKVFPLVLFGAGIFFLVQLIMPTVSFKIWELTTYKENVALVSPSVKSSVLGVAVKNVNNFPAIISENKRQGVTPYKDFSITIPAISLSQIKVTIDSNSFEESLGHLPGTALPGEKGNVFVTGHSSLPQLFKPDNFKTIFSNLPKIKKGDLIFASAGGQQFEYKVIGLKIVDPAETWVINPPDEVGRYLSLMTCVPPGLLTKRLIVLAQLSQ